MKTAEGVQSQPAGSAGSGRLWAFDTATASKNTPSPANTTAGRISPAKMPASAKTASIPAVKAQKIGTSASVASRL